MGGESVFGYRQMSSPDLGRTPAPSGSPDPEKTKAKILTPAPAAAPAAPSTVLNPGPMSEAKREAARAWVERMPQNPNARVFDVDGVKVLGGAIMQAKPLAGGQHHSIINYDGEGVVVNSHQLDRMQDAMRQLNVLHRERFGDWLEYGKSKGWHD